jgi:hypothetical protein
MSSLAWQPFVGDAGALIMHVEVPLATARQHPDPGASNDARAARSPILRDACVHRVHGHRIGRAPTGPLEVRLEHGIAHHPLQVGLGFPDVDDDHAPGAAGADVASPALLLARKLVFELTVVGADQLVGVAIPSEDRED